MEKLIITISKLQNTFASELKNVTNMSDISKLENMYLKDEVKKLYQYLRLINDLQDKKYLGRHINDFKVFLEQKLADCKKNVLHSPSQNVTNKYDRSIIKQNISRGTMHPLIKLYKDIEKVLLNMGFSVVQGPEIELDEYNFGKLNMPPHHPARDMQDTFYIDGNTDTLLRSHTSSVQIRTMEQYSPPIRIISPGTVYRVDDISPQHTPMFYQIEGLLVDKDISFADLKGVLTSLLQNVFGSSTKLRFRPSYYPYTEPSAAVDMSCIICNQVGCRTCNQSGWITILGSGMVHPNVFKTVGYDPNIYSGFAFGMGLNRLALIYYSLSEIRTLYENDMLLYKQI